MKAYPKNIGYRSAFALGSIFAFRMLGLFMILPLFTVYANHLKYATPTLMGIALGSYGLTQALLQLPLGACSDRIGRKPVIALGLSLFVIGSVVAALSTSIYGVIIGRALQGGGAIGSTLIALLSDLTQPEQRSKAMAIIGMVIGLSFLIAIVLGPLINAWIHMAGIFWFTGLLGIIGIILLYTLVPTPPLLKSPMDTRSFLTQIIYVLSLKELWYLDFSIFALHAVLTAAFIVFPMLFMQEAGIGQNDTWPLYLASLASAFIIMLPCLIIAEKMHLLKTFLLIAIIGLITAISLLIFWHLTFIHILVILVIFFTSFIFLESLLPSLVSRESPIASKGTALGIYSTSQFLGIFIGGSLGGIIYSYHSSIGLLISLFLLCLLWLIIVFKIQTPDFMTTQLLPLADNNYQNLDTAIKNILKLDGIKEAFISEQEAMVYIKFDKRKFNKEDLSAYFNLQ